MKDVLGLYIMIKRRLLQIYKQKMGLSPYTQEIYEFLLLKCLGYLRTC